jgi:hypothetical protein
MGEKFIEFLRVTRYLNTEMGINPLLFGSLGLEQRLEISLHADDIDVLIPHTFIYEKWGMFNKKIEELGYYLTDLSEHEFSNNIYKLSFSYIESLQPFAGINVEDIEIIDSENANYMLLTLKQYLAVYEASSKDGYRRNKNNNKDMEKINLIKKHLKQQFSD